MVPPDDAPLHPFLELLEGARRPASARLEDAFAEMRRLIAETEQWDDLVFGPDRAGEPPPRG